MAERGKVGSNLEPHQREFILRCLAEFMRPKDVTRAFQREFRRSIAKSLVSYYSASEKHQETIRHYREELKATILERIPIASKFYRLKRLQELFETENHYRTVRYAKKGKRSVPIAEKPVGELRQILQLVAQEMGDLREVTEVVDRSRDEYVATFDDGEGFGAIDAEVNPPASPDVSEEVTH